MSPPKSPWGGTLAFFLPSLGGGGAERVMVALANRFAQRGARVHLVLAKAEGPYLTDVSPLVQVVGLGASRVAGSVIPLVRYLRREQPKWLMSTVGNANVIAPLAVRLARTRTRTIVRLANVWRTPGRLTLKERLVTWLGTRTLPWADHAIAVSTGVAEDTLAVIPALAGRITVINNPVPVEYVRARAQEPVEHAWFRDGEPPVILGVGRLMEQKDFATLIRAFARVTSRTPARLVILGEGEQRTELEHLVSKLSLCDSVYMPGFVKNPYAYMARAAVFVLSSRWEGFPNVLLEAVALGTPVVATNCPAGPADILQGGRLGPLVPVGDDAAMAQAILSELAKGPGPRAELCRRAEDFSPEAVADRYWEVVTMGESMPGSEEHIRG